MRHLTVAYSEFCQTAKMGLFAKIQPLTVFAIKFHRRCSKILNTSLLTTQEFTTYGFVVPAVRLKKLLTANLKTPELYQIFFTKLETNISCLTLQLND